jgi:hypothetical protein
VSDDKPSGLSEESAPPIEPPTPPTPPPPNQPPPPSDPDLVQTIQGGDNPPPPRALPAVDYELIDVAREGEDSRYTGADVKSADE